MSSDLWRVVAVGSILAVSSACFGTTASDGAQTPAPDPADLAPVAAAGGAPVRGEAERHEAGLLAAREAAAALKIALKGRLVAAMQEQGPVGALHVCHDEAQALTARIAAEQGVKVGRASLRLRNPSNAAPVWVEPWLAAHGEGKAEGVPTDAEVVDTPDGAVARWIEPLPVGPVCLGCHGPTESLSSEVRAVLAEHYPEDRATGYAVGDLRGAVWAEAPVPNDARGPDVETPSAGG